MAPAAVRSIAVTLLVALGAVTVCGADARSGHRAPALVGTLQRFDAVSGTLLVATRGGVEELATSERTRLISGTRTLPLADLAARIGVRVKVAYRAAAGRKLADTVRIAATPSSREHTSSRPTPPAAAGRG